MKEIRESAGMPLSDVRIACIARSLIASKHGKRAIQVFIRIFLLVPDRITLFLSFANRVLFGQRNHAGFDSKMRVQYPYLLDITWVGEYGTLLFTSHPIETRALAFLGDEGRAYEEIVELCRAEGYAEEEIEEILALLITRGQIKEETGWIHKTDTLSISELRRAGEELFKELQAMETVLPRKDLELSLAIAQSLTALNIDDDLGHRQKGHTQLIVLTEAIFKLRARARLAYLEKLERQRDELAKLLRGLDEVIPGFSEPVSFKNHLDGVRKYLEEESASMHRGGFRLREGIQSARNRVITLDDSGIGAYLELEADRLRQRNEALHHLQTHFVSHQQKIQLLKQWINWGERFTRLRHNISKLVMQLKDAEPISAQLAKVLDDLENDVRESFSHYGIATLEQISHVQRLLDDVAREYDRSLAEREMAFEKEKALLAAFLISIADSGKSLRSKYQVSKHEESYHDLYLEVLQIVNEAVDSLMMRVQLLNSRLEGIQGIQARENSASADRRALRAQARKVTDGQKSLLKTQELGEIPRHLLLEIFAEDLNKLREQLDEAERKVPVQTPLSLSAGTLRARLNSEAQDLRALIDVKATMLSLPSDSDLAALLELCLSGDIVIEVYRKSH